MVEPVDPARFELLHMLMACANSASAISNSTGRFLLWPAILNQFSNMFLLHSFHCISNLLALRKAVRAFC